MNDKIRHLYDWVIENGGKLDQIVIHDGEYGCGLFANATIPSNTKFAILPHNLILTQSWCSQTDIGKKTIEQYKKSAKEVDNDEMYLISLFSEMIYGKFHKDHKFYYYLNAIPDEYSDLYWWSDIELKLLNGTHIYKAIKTKKNHYKSLFNDIFPSLSQQYHEIFSSDIYTFSNFKWAISSYFSRGFPEKIYNEKSEFPSRGCLLPLLDLTNHKFNTGITWYHDEKIISFINKYEVKRGDEVFNNYGPKSNSELLIGYGFTIKDNLEDHFIFPFQLSSKDPLFREKQKIIIENNLSNIYYIKYDFIPEGLLQCFRISLLNEKDSILLEGNCGKDMINVFNEFAVWKELNNMLTNEYNKIISNEEKFKSLIRNKEKNGIRDFIIENAENYRNGQVIILERALKRIEENIKLLYSEINTIKYYDNEIPNFYQSEVTSIAHCNFEQIKMIKNQYINTLEKIPSNSVLFTIPIGSIISYDRIESDSEIMKICDKLNLNDEDDIDIIIIYAIYLKKYFEYNPNSCLKSHPTIDINEMSDDIIKKYSISKIELDNYKKELKRYDEIFLQLKTINSYSFDKCKQDEFIDLIQCVKSHLINIEEKLYLLNMPILPRYSPISSNKVEITEDSLIIRNNVDIQENEEIYLDYGMELTNFELLTYYGLLIHYNPYNEALILDNNGLERISTSYYADNKISC